MAVLRNAIYGIPALLVAIIIVASSLALVDASPANTTRQVVAQPMVQLGPMSESISVAGIPIVFSEVHEPTTNLPTGNEGLLLTSKQRAIVNVMTTVGDKVEVTLNIDNKSENDLLMLVNIIAPDTVLVDVLEGSGTDEVRLVGRNLFVMQVSDGDGHDFEVHVTPLTSGFHAIIVEISALG